MKLLNHLALPAKLTSFVDLKEVLASGLRARLTSISNLSGYPMGNHAVGRLISTYLSAGTYNEMITNVKRLRDIVRYTSDMINTAPMFRVDKHALNRTELIAYIELNAASSGMSLTSEEKDFIAYITISAEGSDIGWTLAFSTDSNDNRFIQFHEMYQSILDLNPPSFNDSGKLDTMNTSTCDLTYDLVNDELVKFSTSERVKSLANDLRKEAATKGKTINSDTIQRYNNMLNDMFTIHCISIMRVIDHMFSLVNDVNIWTSFITPRIKADMAQNYERAKGLKAMACYTHSLLMFPHFFSLELFIQTFEKLNSWITIYAPIKSSVIALYDHTVRKFDFLDSKRDASLVLLSIDESSSNPSGSSILGMPRQLSSIFGLDEIEATANSAINNVASKVTIVDLSTLASPIYRSYMLAAPIASFNVAGDMSKVLNFGDMVSAVIKQACSSVQNGLTRYYHDDVVARLSAMDITINYGMSPSISSVDRHDITTTSCYSDGTFSYTPLAPSRSYEYEYYVRNSLSMSVFTSNSLIHNIDNNFHPLVMRNTSSASSLRDKLMTSMTSLMPSNFEYGDLPYTKDQFVTGNEFADKEAIKRLLTSMSGVNFEVIKRQIGAPFLKEVWATYLSSFALLFVAPLDLTTGEAANKKQNANFILQTEPNLLTGYGSPYGTTYSALNAMQGSSLPEDYIFIAEGIYIKFLKFVPLPSSHLKASDNFHLHHPYYYYSASSKLVQVERWVRSEGLTHMTLSQPFRSYNPSPMLLALNYGYLNDRLVSQLDPMYSISASNSDNTFSMPIKQSKWTQDRYVFNIEYLHYGDYAKSFITATEVEIAPLTQIIDEIDKQLAESEKEAKIAENSEKNVGFESLDISPIKKKKSNDEESISDLKKIDFKEEDSDSKE